MISVTVNGSRPFPATVDTGSPITFVPSTVVRPPRGSRSATYPIAGRSYRGWLAKLRVSIGEGCEAEIRDVFIAKKADFAVIGTDVLQSLDCRVNLRKHKLICPPCSLPMFERENEPVVGRHRGRRRVRP